MYVKKDVFTVPDANFGKFLYLVPWWMIPI